MLLGAVAQPIVAYFCAVHTPYIGGRFGGCTPYDPVLDRWPPETVQWWRDAAPADLRNLDPEIEDSRHQRTRDFWMLTGVGPEASLTDFLFRVEAGWPFRSFAGAVWLRRDDATWDAIVRESVANSVLAADGAPMEIPSEWTVQSHGAFIEQFDPLLPKLVPYVPQWPGFVLNVLVYGGAAFLLYAAASTLRDTAKHAGRCTRTMLVHGGVLVACLVVGGIAQAWIAHSVSDARVKPPQFGWQNFATADDVRWWRAHAPEHFPTDPSFGSEYRGRWRRVREFAWTGDSIFGTSTTTHHGHVVESGWPFYSLTGRVWHETAYDRKGAMQHIERSIRAGIRGEAPPPPFVHPERWLVDGAGTYSVGNQNPVIEPRRPIPLGFALNTLVFGLPLWLAIYLPIALLRAVRPRCGRCAQCGYDVRHTGSERCPECGCEVR